MQKRLVVILVNNSRNVIFAQQCLIKIDMTKGGDRVPELN